MVKNIDELFSLLHHVGRVGDLSQQIAFHMGLSEETCKKAFIAGCLHDLGKVFVPDDVISKADILTTNDFALIKEHVFHASKFLRQFAIDDDILCGIEDHHENMDGSGYPMGKSDHEISLLGKILAVADRYDALTSDRVYRKALSVSDAIKVITKERHMIDSKVFHALIDVIQRDVQKNNVFKTIKIS